MVVDMARSSSSSGMANKTHTTTGGHAGDEMTRVGAGAAVAEKPHVR